MPTPNISGLRQQLQDLIGPAPWYWKTFPALRSDSGQRFVWTHGEEQGPLAYVVSLGLEQQPDKPRLALNTYCRPFLIPPARLGFGVRKGDTFAWCALSRIS